MTAMEDAITGIYCERLGPGLLPEPFNAMSNGSFLIAAWVAWSLARAREDCRPDSGCYSHSRHRSASGAASGTRWRRHGP